MRFLLCIFYKNSYKSFLKMKNILSILEGQKPNAALVLENGTVFQGYGLGATGQTVGEACFNTSLTGYQEIITDPSYAGQIITFTFPHIGNTGTTTEDRERSTTHARGVVFKEMPTLPSNWRSEQTLDKWLIEQNIIGIWGIDTRALTQQIRDLGAPKACIVHLDVYKEQSMPSFKSLQDEAQKWSGLNGLDLAKTVTCEKPYPWQEGLWKINNKQSITGNSQMPHVVAVDFGAKDNILRCLVNQGFRVTVVPATTTAEQIMDLYPDGIFLSNGPGDPMATGEYAIPTIKALLEKNIPTFGICLGHQLIALALGAQTKKMHRGHRGANHPVQDLTTGLVEITSQNHGFVVEDDSLPDDVIVTHKSLFDGTNEGIAHKSKPIFSVQHHPEASPGPHDSHYLFDRFHDLIESQNLRKAS
jgi:carbamoyl-phosphate synthase small subunit